MGAGAALASTDATAVGVLARMLPRRNVTLLRAESLINDGTALVIYSLAVGITVGEESLGALHVFLRAPDPRQLTARQEVVDSCATAPPSRFGHALSETDHVRG